MKKIFLSLLILFLSVNIIYATSNTLGEIRADIRRLIKDASSSSAQQRFSDTTLNIRINDAQLEISRKSKCISSITYITTQANIQEYDLPTNFLEIKRAGYFELSGGTTYYKKLEQIDIASADRIDKKWWIATSSIPVRYYITETKIGLDPRPASAYAGTNYLKLEIFAQPTNLTSDSDVPFNGVSYLYPYHSIITYYVVFLCKSDKGEADAPFYYNLFLQKLQMMITELKGLGEYNPIFPALKGQAQ